MSDIGVMGGGGSSIQQYDSDPVSPTVETAWVLRTSTPGALTHTLLHIGLTTTTPVYTYQFKYRTLEGTTVSISLT